MKKNNNRLFVCLSLICVNLAFIWGNSLLPGEISGAISGALRNVLAALFQSGSRNPSAGHGLLRKLAHFTEFCTLGLLLSWLFGMLSRRRLWQLGLPLLCGFSAACLDETIQCFVPDRGPAIKDVGIDTLGVILGIVIIYISQIMKKSKYLEEQTL